MFAGLTAFAMRASIAPILCAALASPLPAHAVRLWSWGYTAGDTDAAGSLTTSDAVTDEKTLDARVEALVRCANRLI
jgi:hypothetical protein